ncbi:unnamed protein product [Ceutorhynchus assimilis]|uniref:DUF8206 domain-containing protein n=1 Tax=Ceutorhynchus assimilis TaxID=467358 RepID=A0A9N9MVE8_9CUCU|nr:unnamed protein product [Ceutorhynchus assimilis]
MGNTDSNSKPKQPNPQYSTNRNPVPQRFQSPRLRSQYLPPQQNPSAPRNQNPRAVVEEELITWDDIDKSPEVKPTNQPLPPPTMAKEAIESKLEDLNLKENKQINILLIGGTGAGKSTFINSIFNYLQSEDFEKAKNRFVNVLIRANFPVTDKNGVRHNIDIGPADDANENLDVGASATQGVKTYSFKIRGGNTLVRLIDTPGMGDTRGIKFDNENCENILQYISRLQELHAICYLAKSEQSRKTVYFEYCFNQIFCRLDKTACKNIIFIFTFSKDSDYHPGGTYELFKEIIDRLRKDPAHAEIPLGANAFCFDNEAFRNLVAIKKGVKLSDHMIKSSVESWNRSTAQCWQMISYISDLKPHMVHNTAAVNEARRIIYQLSQPMADIAQLVNDNIQILRNHQHNLDLERLSLAELRKKLYIPVIDLKVTSLTQPVTVCADISCCEVYKVGEKKEWHYRTRCHDPCFLTNVPRDIMGSAELMSCAAMNGNQSCQKCSHSYKVHMHVYYMTKKEQKQQKDDTISKTIDTREEGIQRGRVVMREIEERKTQLENELKSIVRCNAKFAHFLCNNAITAYSDSYAEYIRYLKEQEKHLGSNADLVKLTGLENLLREHEEMKKVFQEAADLNKKLGRDVEITPQEINKTKQELFNLKINGKKIRELFESQSKSLKKEYKFLEYTHKAEFQQTAPKTSKDNNSENKGQSSASNPTQKFQRGRAVGRGNFNNNRGRGKSAGPQNRNQRDRTPPPSYNESSRYPPRGNVQTHHHGGNIPPLMPPHPSDYYRGPPQPPPPPPAPYHAYDPPPRSAYDPPPRSAYDPPPRSAYDPPPRPAYGPPPDPHLPPTAGPRPEDPHAKIQVNVTYGGTPQDPSQPTTPRDPPPRDYREYSERRDYPDRRDYPERRDYPQYDDRRDYPRDYPPYHERREYPPHPRDHPSYQDPRDYPPHRREYPDPAYPDHRDYAREPVRDPYYPPPPPAPAAADPYYRHDARYPDQRPYTNDQQRNRPYYNNQRSSGDESQTSNRGRQFSRGGPNNNYNNNYRGNNRGSRGGIHRRNRRRNDNNANSNSGDESDTSVPSLCNQKITRPF